MGNTSKFWRNLACFNRVVLRLRVLFWLINASSSLFLFWGPAVTLNPWMQSWEGSNKLWSNAFVTYSLWFSGSNGNWSSVLFKLSNSTGPNTNGLGIFFFSALSKLDGRKRSYSSSLFKSIYAAASSAGSSSAPFPFFLALAFAFLAASMASSLFYSSDFLSNSCAFSSFYYYCSYSEILFAYNSPIVFDRFG